jgi:hypothetical protein
MMQAAMTLQDIVATFQSEWVLMEDPQMDATDQLKGGKVLFHSKDRDETYRKILEFKPKRFAIYYTGKIADDAAVVL